MTLLPSTRKQRVLSFLLAGLIAAGVGMGLRFFPLYSYVSPEAYEKGALLALKTIRDQITERVARNAAGLPEMQAKLLIQKTFDDTVRNENARVRKLIHKTSREVQKGLPPSDKPPYLQASDSFYYYSLSERIMETGSVSDTIRGSKYLNDRMLAPEGHWEPLNLHPYLGAYLHRLIRLFHPKAQLMFSVAFMPIIVSLLCLLPYLFICSLLGCSAAASLVGALFLFSATVFLERSIFGWYDNDPYNIFFPLLVLAVFFQGLLKAHDLKALLRCGILVSLTMGLYTLFWHGWVFLASVLAGSGVLIVLFDHVLGQDKGLTRRLFFFILLSLGGAFLCVGAVFGFGEFFVLFKEGWTALNNFLHPQLNLWPDLYIAVGELHRASFWDVLSMTGGKLCFVFAVLGLATRYWRARRPEHRREVMAVITLNVFFVLALVLAMGAKRFALLYLVPASLLLPLGLQSVLEAAADFLKKRFSRQAHWQLARMILISVMAAMVAAVPLFHAWNNAPSLLHNIFSEPWEKALLAIERDTPKDSIVNTWWSPGHFITAIAKRRVTFDGATINVPQAYWLANVYLAQDEAQGLGILRMLNNCANQAADYLTGLGLPLSKSVDILKFITPMSRQRAEQFLAGILMPGQIPPLLNLTHRRPPPTYLLLYNDLVDKNIQLTFVGRWNFKKVEEINSDPQQLRRVPSSRDIKKYVSFLWKLAGEQPRFSEALIPMLQDQERIVFEHNVALNLKDLTVSVASDTFGKGVPSRLFYLDGDRIVEKVQPGASLGYSALYANVGEEPVCLLMDTFLARSLLMRLYYFKGQGLRYIKPFAMERNLTRRTEISVYKIDWDDYLKDIGEADPAPAERSNPEFEILE